MSECIKNELWFIIDEMSNAYQEVSGYEALNADYAEYAGMAIGRFRDVLKNQSLTPCELDHMLRHGIATHKRDGDMTDWRRFVASYMAQASNANIQMDA